MAKARKKLTHVGAVVDESGSMGHAQHQTEEAYGSFLGKLQDTPADVRVSLTIFDDKVRHPYEGEYLANAKGLSTVGYDATRGGGTNLYDAFGDAIESHARRAAEADQVIMVIITDGADTGSARRPEQIRKMVDEKKATGRWQFIWLGPNAHTAEEVGVDPNNIFQLDAGGAGIIAALAAAAERTQEFLMLTEGSPAAASAS